MPGLRVNPRVPQTNLLHLFFDADAERVLQARDGVAQDTGCWLVDRVKPAAVPGFSVTEFYVGDRLLAMTDAEVLPLFETLINAARG